MELKYNVIKPNLYIAEDEVVFSADPSDIISVARSIDEIVGKHISELKVKESDIETIRTGKSKLSKENTAPTSPLREYLSALEEDREHTDAIRGITNDSTKLFGISYLIHASTLRNPKEVIQWCALREMLIDPDKGFDEYENEDLFRLDRQKTLEQIKKLNEESSPKIPDNSAEFFVMCGSVRAKYLLPELKNVGMIKLIQLKAKDRTIIDNAKSELVEKLKEVDGPCLSLDAHPLLKQVGRMYSDASELIQKYGDILKDPAWKTKFFRFDP